MARTGTNRDDPNQNPDDPNLPPVPGLPNNPPQVPAPQQPTVTNLGSTSQPFPGTGALPPANTPTAPTGTGQQDVVKSGMAQNNLTGIDPRLTSFFQQNNITPTGPGTGGTDISQWNTYLQQPGADWNYLQGRILGAVQGGNGAGSGYGGFNNIPGLYNQIAGNLPPLPNTQIDASQFNGNSGPYESQLRDAIMNAIQTGQQPITENDPLIAPLLSAIRGQGQRSMEQNQQLVGEQLYGQGIPTSSGAWDSRVLGYNQMTNEGTQNQVANLMVQQLTDRQNRLMTALNVGSNYLNAQQSRQLQAELANVNNALQGYGMQQNTSLSLLQQILGNAQFYNQLGTNAGMFAQNSNQNNPLLTGG